MAVRMYCAPPTKIDSILRCLETLCDFASVSRTLHTHTLANCLSSLAIRCRIHACARPLALTLSMSQNTWCWGRKTDASAAACARYVHRFFRGGRTKFITTRVSITRKPYILTLYHIHILRTTEWCSKRILLGESEYTAQAFVYSRARVYTLDKLDNNSLFCDNLPAKCHLCIRLIWHSLAWLGERRRTVKRRCWQWQQLQRWWLSSYWSLMVRLFCTLCDIWRFGDIYAFIS